MLKPKKFTPLESQKIAQILDNSPELKELATIIGPEIAKFSEDSTNIRQDYISNYERAIKFLYEIGLTGDESDKDKNVEHGNHNINADALRVINAYNRQKNPENKSCLVEVLTSHDGSFPDFYDSFISKSLLKAVKRDFKDLKVEDEFSKTYMVVAGINGSHVNNVSIKKQREVVEPVVEVFDSSPKLVREGLDTAQQLTKWGTLEQIIAQSTINKAFEGTEFSLKNENYFHNSEPFQRGGPSYCGTYAMEQAYETEKQGIEERIDYLRSVYKYDSILGGKTELDISYEEAFHEAISRKPKTPSSLGGSLPRNFQGIAASMSHFNSALSSEDPNLRKEYLNSQIHVRKSGETESFAERRNRYLVDIGPDKKGNSLSEEKSMRHRLHLFEIITSPEFQEFAKKSQKELEGEPLTPNGQITQSILDGRSANTQSQASENAQKIEVFKQAFGYPYKTEFFNQENRAKIDYRSGTIHLKKFQDIISKNTDLRSSCEFEIKEERIGENFGEVKVHEEMRKKFVIDLTVTDCEKFFKTLENLVTRKPSPELEPKQSSAAKKGTHEKFLNS